MINNKREHIGRYISQIHRKSNSFITKEVSNFGIGSGQIMFLMQLYKKDGISQEELSENLSIDKGTTCRAIKKLEEEEFLIKVKDEKDKRSNKIYLSDKAKNIREDIFNILDDWNKQITRSLAKEEVKMLEDLLEKVSKNINL